MARQTGSFWVKQHTAHCVTGHDYYDVYKGMPYFKYTRECLSLSINEKIYNRLDRLANCH